MKEINISEGKVIFYDNYFEIRYNKNLDVPKNHIIIENNKIDSLSAKEYRLNILAYIIVFLFILLIIFILMNTFIPLYFLDSFLLLFIISIFVLCTTWFLYKVKVLIIYTGNNCVKLNYNNDLLDELYNIISK